jgi:hypothetical protein
MERGSLLGEKGQLVFLNAALLRSTVLVTSSILLQYTLIESLNTITSHTSRSLGGRVHCSHSCFCFMEL